MRLIYLYGPPGVGKLTVATELAALTGFRLLHNHLTVNLVKSVFPFNSEPYIRLVRQFRQDMVAEAARANVDLIVTGVYNGSVEQLAFIRRFVESVPSVGGTVVWVRLACDPQVWHARLANESRLAHDKLTDPARALAIFEQGDPFVVMPVDPTLTLDVTDLAPSTAAAQIAAHYALL